MTPIPHRDMEPVRGDREAKTREPTQAPPARMSTDELVDLTHTVTAELGRGHVVQGASR